jgi:asparagine synthetase B (glutamine-hydrolysing)
VRGSEDDSTIDKRKKIIESNNCYHQDLFKNDKGYADSHNYIVKNTEPYNYSIYSDVGDYNQNIRLVDDSGSNWLSLVCGHARQDGYKVCLSGGGADEIISDYGIEGHRIFPQSNFGGKFPEDLRSIFPWASFYGSSMESYMMKEEYVGGAYGIETRYPFLDKKVVQEFLNLDISLKNTHYKSAIYEYLTRNEVPFAHCSKIGF